MSPEEEKQRGLTRDRLVEAALELIGEEGLEGLSMRALADQLEVKAASLYWHVRDRDELLEMLADAILDKVRPAAASSDWRQAALSTGSALARRVAAQRDAARVLLEAPDALERSAVFGELRGRLQAAGLQPGEAAEVARTIMVQAITARPPADRPAGEAAAPAWIAIDSGSRGVVLRAGSPDMQGPIRVARDRSTAAPAVVRGETVVVRRLRGVGLGELELNPRLPWNFKIQAPTWNTVLDVGGLDVRRIQVDSGATKVECFLPRPRGVVPIHISSGVVDVALHRPRGAAVVARVHTGSVKLHLEDFRTKVTVSDVSWESEQGAAAAADRYELEVSSGVMKLDLDSYVPKAAAAVAVPPAAPPLGRPASALEILLDGVEARLKSRRA